MASLWNVPEMRFVLGRVHLVLLVGLVLCSCSKQTRESTKNQSFLPESEGRENAEPLQAELISDEAVELRGKKDRETMGEMAFDDTSPKQENGLFQASKLRESTPNVVPSNMLVHSDLGPGSYTKQRIQGLILERVNHVSLSDDEVARWTGNLSGLIQQGNNALPAIREYLNGFEDSVFGPEDQHLLGYPTTRIALMDALHHIGGDDALALSLEVLQSTADPAEIAFLAESLQLQAGDEYREATLTAAWEALEMAKDRKVEAEEVDVGPLFEVLYRFGDERIAPDLADATGRWRHYGLISLAQLPKGAGIPMLVEIAQTREQIDAATRSQALVILAQVSTQWDEARETLIEQAREDRIPEFYWHSIASSLAGDTYQLGADRVNDERPVSASSEYKRFYIRSGNQSFSSDPSRVVWSMEEIDERIALIDELLTIRASPTAADLLQRSRGELVNRLQQIESESSLSN